MRRLSFLLLVAVAATGCVVTKTRDIGASQPILERNGVGPGDTVLLRYANESDPRSSSRSEIVRLDVIGSRGVVGVNASGEVVVAMYDQLFRVQVTQSSLAMPGLVGSTASGVAKTLFIPLMVGCAWVAPEAADACFELVGAGD